MSSLAGKVERASLLYMLLYIQSLGFIFHNGGLSSCGWVLLFFRACSSLISLKMRERPPYIKHCKHFTQRSGEVIYSLQSVVSGFKAVLSKEDRQAQSNKEALTMLFLCHCAQLHFCVQAACLLLEIKVLGVPDGTNFTCTALARQVNGFILQKCIFSSRAEHSGHVCGVIFQHKEPC